MTIRMDIKECIRFANENPLCSLATVEVDQPRVRMVGLWYADETGFYFQTNATKELYGDLEANPKVEVCFYKHEGMIGTMLRVAGEIQLVTDLQYRERVMKDRPFLKSFGLTVDNPNLCIFKIKHGEAHFWTMENNMRPKEIIEF
jgi:pyridoxamine 5'-phosphate oxidase